MSWLGRKGGSPPGLASLGLKHGEKIRQSTPSFELELKLEHYVGAFIELCEGEQDLLSEALGYSQQTPAMHLVSSVPT
jgi:hypothetical protein